MTMIYGQTQADRDYHRNRTRALRGRIEALSRYALYTGSVVTISAEAGPLHEALSTRLADMDAKLIIELLDARVAELEKM